MDPDKMFLVNERCAHLPRPGDYWHEMSCPILVVLAVDDSRVCYLDKRVNVDGTHWRWDHLAKPKIVSRDSFRRYLRYDENGKYWADAIPMAHMFILPFFPAICGPMEQNDAQ